jgi:hypothetical protein
MSKRLINILVILPFFTILCFPQDTPEDNRLREIIRKNGQAEVAIPSPGASAIDYITRNVSIISVKDKTVHIMLSPLTVEWFIFSHYDYTIIERSYVKGIANSVSMDQAMEWESYPTWRQYDSIMRFFAGNYPSICKLDTIGTSINGKLIYALKISDNVNDDEDQPEVFYSSTIHGDETGGFVLMLRLADYLLKNYNLSSRVKNLVDNLEIWINPLANPDGTYTTGNIITSPVRDNANGYDLNRNFPDPNTPNTVKQKETLDMMRFLGKHRFVISANFHSGAEVVNYPWDRWERYHADDNWFYGVSRAYADTVHMYSPPGYMDDLDNGVTNGYEWYPVYGGRQDYVTYELQGRETTIELDNNYITPAENLPSLWESNHRSLFGYLENALYGIHGKVNDGLTRKPVPAKVFITGHDKDNSHIYSDTLAGRFIRLLETGSWNLTFTANGYRDTVVNDIIVNSGQKTDIIVEMKPVFNPVDTTNPAKPLLYPNPGSTCIKAVLPERIRGAINIKIFNLAGMKLSDYNTEAVDGIPVSVDVSWLAGGTYIIVFTNRVSKISFKSRFIIVRRF